MVQNDYFFVSRSEFWAYYLKSKNAKYLLKKGVYKDVALAGEVFNEYVTVLNIETSAYCNRRCSYCPVAERPRQQRIMDDKIFETIIDEMVKIDYRGMVGLSLFNEPLADRDILEKVSFIKKALPYCYIRMNTNGDYLTREYLDELAERGCDELLITMHMTPNETYTDELAHAKLAAFFDKIGLEMKIKYERSGHNITCDEIYNGVRMLVVTNNWSVDGADRGGTVEDLSIEDRQEPCPTAFREVVLDVDGNFRHCFNVYVDEKPIANVRESGIIETFFSDIMVDIRRRMLMFGSKDGLSCKTCNTPDNSKKESIEARKALLESV